MLGFFMAGPLDQQPNDVGVIFVPPASLTDPRVPTAEELSLSVQIQQSALLRQQHKIGWQRYPVLGFTAARQLSITNGEAIVPGYPGVLAIDSTAITLPSLPDTTNTYLRTDWLYLLSFTAEVGQQQDPILGQYTFQYTEIGGSNVSTITKENTRRLRAFWCIIWSAVPTSIEALLALLPNAGDKKQLQILDTSALGFEVGGVRVYARDPRLTQHPYVVLPGSMQLLEVSQVRRAQRQNNRGYIHGSLGEAALGSIFNLVTTAPLIQTQDLESQMRERLRGIFSGMVQPGRASNYAIQNLTASPNGGNPDFPGEGAAAPNGSICLANGQRVSFTNQAIVEKRAAIRIGSVSNNGSGRALITVSLNSPIAGSFFSGNRSDHKIYSATGLEQSERGTFRQLGSSSSLVWEGDVNSTILPGQTAFVVPGIFYPAGSGFSVPFERVVRWWRNNVELDPLNIREAATNDVLSYTEPANNGSYFGVFGRERAALHYILRKVLITSDGSGIAAIPAEVRGCFAFIQGVAERIDAPIVTGLPPNTTLSALVYEAVDPTEVWQFMMLYPEYQGTQETSFLNGSTVVSRPLLFAHTQGGGCSVYQGDADTRLSAIAMHLPAVGSGIPAYRLNAPIQVAGEPYPGPITLRELPILPAPALALPTPGQILTVQAASTTQGRSLSIRLLSNGQPLGFRTPQLQGRAEYQAVVSFVVRKGDQQRIVVLTRNTNGGENCPANSDQFTAIDTFRF
ncbi:MAG: hypothetical protein SNJ57_12070 [Cyanobacteriota bacterium]